MTAQSSASAYAVARRAFEEAFSSRWAAAASEFASPWLAAVRS